MGQRFNQGNYQKQQFYQMPKVLMDDPAYAGLSPAALVVYLRLFDLFRLSIDNKWIDSNGDYYIKRKQSDLTRSCHLKSPKTLRTALRELEDVGLIDTLRQGKMLPNIIYLREWDVSEVKGKNYPSKKVMGKNYPHDGQKLPIMKGKNYPHDGSNLPTNKNNDNKNQLNKNQLNKNNNTVANAPSASVVVSKDLEKDLSTDMDTEMKKEDGCSQSQSQVLQKLYAMGMTKKKAEALLREYSIDRIIRNLQYTNTYAQTSNPAGLMIRATENDWGAHTRTTTSNDIDDERMTSYDSPAVSYEQPYEPSDFAANLALHEEEARARGRALLAKLCGGTH